MDPAVESGLVVLAMHGDRAAFSELVRLRHCWLRNLLRRLCRDAALADDLAQQTLLQAWRSLPSLRESAAFAGWLRRLAVNAFLMHVRRVTPEIRADQDGRGEPATPTTGLALDLDNALSQLAAAERLCIVLAYNEGLSHGEIASATGLPLGTVKSHIRRGAARLRTLLVAYDQTGERAHAG